MAQEMTREKPPLPILEKTVRGVIPASAYDAEALDAFPIGTQFDVKARTKRTVRHNGTYWKALTVAVNNSDIWPTPVHLHMEIKQNLGYVQTITLRPSGVKVDIPDSTAFDEMSHEEFIVYFEKAMQWLSAVIGYDPLEWMRR